MNDNQHNILCVDDEPNVLRALKRLLRKENFGIFTASSGKEGLQILATETIHLVICDQRMPEMSGIEFLSRVRGSYPDIVRITLTGYTEVDAITESINQGYIYKFFLKPWNDQALKLEIRKALEHYELSIDNRRLNRALVEKNRDLEIMNANLEGLVRERTEELAFRNQALEVSHAILEDLPLPVVGVSADGMVVLANAEARKLFEDRGGFELGMSVGDFFPLEMQRLIEGVLKDHTSRTSEDLGICSHVCGVCCIPLSGRFRSHGVILAFKRCCQLPVGDAAACGDDCHRVKLAE